ncbi:MAG: GNAT family N-acetyltransferase [Planctomycetota bacterium]|nr:GNAT family N-acetyltransferase [Planctomycetota bacterium]
MALRTTTPTLDLDQGPYRLRFARTEADVDAVAKLRHRVFQVELAGGEPNADGADRDRFDEQFDHLMIEDRDEGVVGTYRLQVAANAREAEGFYTASEFDLAPLEPILEEAIEAGRACVASTHRKGLALSLLWRGLAEYQRHNGKRYFFGCSSITSRVPAEGLATYAWLEDQGHLHQHFQLSPRPELACHANGQAFQGVVTGVAPLFRIYLRYGAKVCSLPAVDSELGTIDFVTMLDLEDLAPGTVESFGVR